MPTAKMPEQLTPEAPLRPEYERRAGALTLRQRMRLATFRRVHPRAEIAYAPGFGFWAGWVPTPAGGICVNRYEGLDTLLDDLETALRAEGPG